MKKSILALVVLVCLPVFLYSIEPPVDIVELDYDNMINSGEGELSNNQASFPGTVKYLGEEIHYSSNFDLDDNKERYLFFSRYGVDNDTFYEYCREIIKHYINQSSYFYVESSFALSREDKYITAQNLYFFVKEKPVINVYIQNNHDEGVYGFGIQPINNGFLFNNGLFQRVNLLIGRTVYSFDSFNFNETYSPNTIFAAEEEFFEEDTPLTNTDEGIMSDDGEKYTIGRTVLLPETEKWGESYNVTIDSQNLDGIKQVYFISNNYESMAYVYAGKEIDFNDNTFSIYTELDDLVLFEELPYTMKIGSAYNNSSLTVLFKYSSEQEDKSPEFTIDIEVVENEE